MKKIISELCTLVSTQTEVYKLSHTQSFVTFVNFTGGSNNTMGWTKIYVSNLQHFRKVL